MCQGFVDGPRKFGNFKRNSSDKEKRVTLNQPRTNISLDVANRTNNIHYLWRKLMNQESVVFLDGKYMNCLIMEKCSRKFVPNISKDFIVCISCYDSLQHHTAFINNCLKVEDSIRRYCKPEERDCKCQLKIDRVAHFMIKRSAKNGNNNSNMTISKLHTKCEEIEDYTEVKIKNKNIRSKEEVLNSENEDISTVIGQSNRLHGNILLLTQKNGSKMTQYECKICGYQTDWRHVMDKHIHKHTHQYQTKYKHQLQSRKLVHDSSTERQSHKCDRYLYETKDKYRLQKHRLVHRYSSEAAVCKCNMCGFQTMHNRNLRTHFLIAHKGCKFSICGCKTKEQLEIENHIQIFENSATKNAPQHHKTFEGTLPLLRHITKVKLYRCRICGSQTRWKRIMKTHICKHNTITSVMTKYNWSTRLYGTKYKQKHQNYKPPHRYFSEITMYKCNKCAFQSVYDSIVQTHLFIAHKGYKFRLCGCKSKEQLEDENQIRIQESCASKYYP